MSYNYSLNTIDSSVGCNINNTNSPNAYREKMKNEVNQSVGFRPLGNYKNQIQFTTLGNINVNIESSLGDKRLRSDKLKVLLKNGGNTTGNKADVSDPYAFNDLNQQNSESSKQALTNGESFGRKNQREVNVNGTTEKSIMFSKTVSPQTTSNGGITNEKEYNDETVKDFKRNMKITKFSSSSLGTNNFLTSDLNQVSGFKLQQTNHQMSAKQSRMLGLKNGKTAQVHLPSNSKPLLNKLFGKAKLQNIKSTSMIDTLKGNRGATGKPMGFGSSQAIKHQNMLKGEKKPESKHKTFQKGKSLLTQLQKTALLNRPGSQQLFKNSNKGPFFGMNKNIQRHEESHQGTNKKSLLEESLLGLKSNHNSDKDSTNGLKSKLTMESNGSKPGYGSTHMTTNANPMSPPTRLGTNSLDQGKHESLERIWNIRNKLKGLKRDHHHFGLTINDGDYDDNQNSECLLFQNYWFSVCGDSESLPNNDRQRDTKLSQLKVELRHKIKQLQWRYKDEYRDKVVELLVDSARKQPNLTAFLIRLENSKFNSRKKISRVKPFSLLRPVLCSYSHPESGEKCPEKAMPCVKFCQQHITQSNDQLLFAACRARRSDNTTCQAAVLPSQNPENPLCLEHKRLVNKSGMPKNNLNSKPVSRPSQPRKRSRSSTGGSNRSGRSRKRRRSAQKGRRELFNGDVDMSAIASNSTDNSSSNFNYGKDFVSNGSFKHQNIAERINPQIISKCEIDESQEVEVGEEVLAIAEDLPLELASQATKLLEEHDFTNVLNHIPADAFNDLFTEDKEEYEPTPQETEELERALEAVDKDVKSLEKLSQTQGILDTLLDEQTIAQTLAQLPEVTANIEVPQTLVPVFYQNGFSNINQLEQTLNDVNKSLTQTVLLNQGTEGIANHFNTITIPNHADVLQS